MRKGGRFLASVMATVLVVSACGSKSATAPTTTSTPTTIGGPGSNLKGMGATIAAMIAAHGADHGPGATCSAANACFGPGLMNNESGETYLFTNVLTNGGLITGYQQNFAPNTSAATAEQDILQWMPPGSTMGSLTVDHNGGSCGMYDISSPTLATLTAFGDPQGVIGVELEYTDANLNVVYDPNNVQDATLSVVPSDPTTAC